jgi:hypothetical protein
MDFDLIKKNRPNLTDHSFLQKIIENKKVPTPLEPTEPTLIQKTYLKLKNGLYNWVENNMFIIFVVCFIIALLIYRYFQYQSLKNKLINEEPYYGYNYKSPYLDQYMPEISEITEEHFDTDLVSPKEQSINIVKKPIKTQNMALGRKKKKYRNVQINTTVDQTIPNNVLNPNQTNHNQTNHNQTNHNQTNHNMPNPNQTNSNLNINPDQNNSYMLNDPSMYLYNQQHNECVSRLLNLTNDRMLTTNNNSNNLNIINSSSYAPYNLKGLNDFHPFNS